LPTGVGAIIGGFMFAFVLAFSLAAAASLKARSYAVASLLLMPVFMWGTILVIGATGDMKEALQLDIYANVAIAASFVGLRLSLRHMEHTQWAGSTD
jgi:hypothetical protein